MGAWSPLRSPWVGWLRLVDPVLVVDKHQIPITRVADGLQDGVPTTTAEHPTPTTTAAHPHGPRIRARLTHTRTMGRPQRGTPMHGHQTLTRRVAGRLRRGTRQLVRQIPMQVQGLVRTLIALHHGVVQRPDGRRAEVGILGYVLAFAQMPISANMGDAYFGLPNRIRVARQHHSQRSRLAHPRPHRMSPCRHPVYTSTRHRRQQITIHRRQVS